MVRTYERGADKASFEIELKDLKDMFIFAKWVGSLLAAEVG